MLRDDIALARHLYELCEADPELEPRTTSLSITTFRYVPPGIDADAEGEYLDELNEQVLARLNASGEAFVSNAIVDERFYLRACVVNFRTAESDMDALAELTRGLGRELHVELRAEASLPD
jgi:aromatic-L-amino-acid/L-tryptophan decarboxylase